MVVLPLNWTPVNRHPAFFRLVMNNILNVFWEPGFVTNELDIPPFCLPPILRPFFHDICFNIYPSFSRFLPPQCPTPFFFWICQTEFLLPCSLGFYHLSLGCLFQIHYKFVLFLPRALMDLGVPLSSFQQWFFQRIVLSSSPWSHFMISSIFFPPLLHPVVVLMLGYNAHEY